MPILPLVLINGAEGIGTGWSTYIPNYSPREVADNLRRLLAGQPTEPMAPWYRGFRCVESESMEMAGAEVLRAWVMTCTFPHDPSTTPHLLTLLPFLCHGVSTGAASARSPARTQLAAATASLAPWSRCVKHTVLFCHHPAATITCLRCLSSLMYTHTHSLNLSYLDHVIRYSLYSARRPRPLYC